MSDERSAPGAPGIAPRWTSSAKSGVGTAASQRSRVWFTISHGILNEIYYPRLDQANTRDMGLIITAGSDFFSEEKRHTTSVIETIAPGVPGYRLTNTCTKGRYRIVKTVLTDPDDDVVLQHTQFDALTGSRSDYRLYILLAPHLGNQGAGKSGWIGDGRVFDTPPETSSRYLAGHEHSTRDRPLALWRFDDRVRTSSAAGR